VIGTYSSHVAVNTVICDLLGHAGVGNVAMSMSYVEVGILRVIIDSHPPCSIVDDNIDPVGRIGNLFGYPWDGCPVGEVAVDPVGPVCSGLAQLLGDGFLSAIHDFF